jgi:hypothetical protein
MEKQPGRGLEKEAVLTRKPGGKGIQRHLKSRRINIGVLLSMIYGTTSRIRTARRGFILSKNRAGKFS